MITALQSIEKPVVAIYCRGNQMTNPAACTYGRAIYEPAGNRIILFRIVPKIPEVATNLLTIVIVKNAHVNEGFQNVEIAEYILGGVDFSPVMGEI